MAKGKLKGRARREEDARRRRAGTRIALWSASGIAVAAVAVIAFVALSSDGAVAAPAFSLVTTDGEALSGRDLRGEVYVMDFFFLTCGICEIQLPYNKQLADEFRDRDDFTLVSVTADPADTVPAIEEHRAEKGAWWPHVRDTFGLYRKFEVKGNPNLVFVDREGNVAFLVNDITNGYQLIDFAERLLAGEKAGAAEQVGTSPDHETHGT